MCPTSDCGVIILNEKDRKVYNYVLKSVGETNLKWAVKNLSGNRKPYISNIVKILKIEVPNESLLQDPEKVIPIDQGIDMLRQVIRIKSK